jgi:hypothetical protein
MIPDIGIMIGLYIITRMIVVGFDPQQRTTSRVFAWITVLTAIICIADLLAKGSPVMPGRLP